MKCPKCGSDQLHVTDSRPVDVVVKRRRECLDCGHRFSTAEITMKEYKLYLSILDQKNRLMGLSREFAGVVQGIMDSIPDNNPVEMF
jgi:transcriptional repressor NrdR